jgi:hypothetical protein
MTGRGPSLRNRSSPTKAAISTAAAPSTSVLSRGCSTAKAKQGGIVDSGLGCRGRRPSGESVSLGGEDHHIDVGGFPAGALNVPVNFDPRPFQVLVAGRIVREEASIFIAIATPFRFDDLG